MKDPLDKIFLTKEQSVLFRKGKESGIVEERMRNKREPTKKLTFDENICLTKLEESLKENKQLKERIRYLDNRTTREENKIIEVLRVLKGIIPVKIYKRVQRICWSASRKYDKGKGSHKNL